MKVGEGNQQPEEEEDEEEEEGERQRKKQRERYATTSTSTATATAERPHRLVVDAIDQERTAIKYTIYFVFDIEIQRNYAKTRSFKAFS